MAVHVLSSSRKNWRIHVFDEIISAFFIALVSADINLRTKGNIVLSKLSNMFFFTV
jgi:hypothetical protein